MRTRAGRGGWRPRSVWSMAVGAFLLAVPAHAQPRGAPSFEFDVTRDGQVARLIAPIEGDVVETWIGLTADAPGQIALALGAVPGGSPIEALQFADLVRVDGTYVVIEEGQLCDAACSLIFLGATRGTALSPLEIVAPDEPAWLDEAVATALASFGAPEGVIAAFAAAPGTVTRFELAELEAMGLRTRNGPPAAPRDGRWPDFPTEDALTLAGEGRFRFDVVDLAGRWTSEVGEAQWYAGDFEGSRVVNVRVVAPTLDLAVHIYAFDVDDPGIANVAMYVFLAQQGDFATYFVGTGLEEVPLLLAIGPERPTQPLIYLTTTEPAEYSLMLLSPIFSDRNAHRLATAEHLLFGLTFEDGRQATLRIILDGVGRRVIDEALAVWPMATGAPATGP